jgi:hypothetical protein
MTIAREYYELVFCDVGTNGRISDGGVLDNTKFYLKLVDEHFNICKAEKARTSDEVLN